MRLGRYLGAVSIVAVLCPSVTPSLSAAEWPQIEIRDRQFRDAHGRRLTFRGINLGGSSKVPASPALPTHTRSGFFDHRNVSFIDRPFPLHQADDHLARIAGWGFNLVRLVVTWEAIEHAGPGVYDQHYLTYIERLIEVAEKHGLWVLVDPHQDAWSRFTGGDGAPGWTLEAVGFDLEGLHPSGAAYVHNVAGDPYPAMLWPTNYTKLGAATMFTLFFAGSDLAPATRIDDEPVQEFLQRHYVAAFSELARRVGARPNVLGFEVMNEPHPGWVGEPDAGAHCDFPLKNLATPTPFEAMQAAAGRPTRVENWKISQLGVKPAGHVTLNPDGRTTWQAGESGVWRQNGVWDIDAQGRTELLRSDHFGVVGARQVDFLTDYYKPFLERYSTSLREEVPGLIVVYEPAFVYGLPRWSADYPDPAISGAHWYDQVTLVKKRFFRQFGVNLRNGRPVLGSTRIDRMFTEQVAAEAAMADNLGRHAATLIGEVGVPFDLDRGRGLRSDTYVDSTLALDRSLRAIEANGLSYCLWNYTADNDHLHGDQWNGENLSVYSPDSGGGRALRAVVRPFPVRLAGEVVHSSYDFRRAGYDLAWQVDPGVSAPTEIVLPEIIFGDEPEIELAEGTYELDLDTRILRIQTPPGAVEPALRVRSTRALEPIGDEGRRVGFIVALVGITLLWWLLRRRTRDAV